MASSDPEERDEDDLSFVSASAHGNDGDDAASEIVDRPPVHPIACMQGAFEESIMETMEGENRRDSTSSTSSMDSLDAKARRQKLLEGDYNGPHASHGKKKPGAKFHRLWKLMAQISFGVHLLHQQLAKSDEEVVKIMQSHVDELDTFLEKTTEDFDLAIADINERINYLQLPLEHVNIFDIMLDDKPFRTSIVEGNEKIERIVERTARHMTDALEDVNVGIEATAELAKYLDKIGEKWTDGDEDLKNIYEAMHANVEGWYSALGSLQLKGNTLGGALVQLGGILNEMSKRAGVASRRSLTTQMTEPGSRGSPRVRSHPPTSRYSPSQTPGNKPLPQDPEMVTPVTPSVLPPRNAVPLQLRYQYPRKQPKPPVPEPKPVNGPDDAKEGIDPPQTANAASSPRISVTPTQQPPNSKKPRAPSKFNPNNSSKSFESPRPSLQSVDRYAAPPAPVDSAYGSSTPPSVRRPSAQTYQRTPTGSKVVSRSNDVSQLSLATSQKTGNTSKGARVPSNPPANASPAPAVPGSRDTMQSDQPAKKSSGLSSIKKLFHRKQSSK